MINENEIARCVRRTLDGYFRDLDGEKPGEIYSMVISCVEKPLIEVVLHKVGGNQTVAAELLGLNRNTLRRRSASSISTSCGAASDQCVFDCRRRRVLIVTNWSRLWLGRIADCLTAATACVSGSFCRPHDCRHHHAGSHEPR